MKNEIEWVITKSKKPSQMVGGCGHSIVSIVTQIVKKKLFKASYDNNTSSEL